jgi:hypothetical protein
MHTPLPRRHFLRATGISLALPFLESMTKAVGAPGASQNGPRRLVAIGTPFGFDPYVFVPGEEGRDYKTTPHLEHLKAHRNDFTIFSGLSHPNTGGGGHKAEAVILTGAPYPDYSYNLKNTISLDQAFAAHFRGQTRYDSLVLSTTGGTLSYTGNGVAIPALSSPAQVFGRLFLSSTPQQQTEELRKIGSGRSMLDFVGEQAKRLSASVTPSDRARLDEYFESVREVERQMQMSGEWVTRPKPAAPQAAPQDINGPGQQQKKLQLMFDMTYLALQTDSTRAVTIKTFGDHHDLSHHGKEPTKLNACRQVEVELLQAYSGLLDKLKAAREGAGASMLDQTMVLMTSNLRDGNTHWTHNLPVLLAGGGFKHGQHLAFNKPYLETLADPANDKKPKATPTMGRDQTPLCNLYLSMLQRAGVPADRFSSSTGTLTGLELV